MPLRCAHRTNAFNQARGNQPNRIVRIAADAANHDHDGSKRGMHGAAAVAWRGGVSR